MDLKEAIIQAIKALKLGNMQMVLDPDCGSRAGIAMTQNNLLDSLELVLNGCDVSVKEEGSKD